MPIPSSLEEPINELARDSLSGATSLAQRAASVFLRLVDPQLEVSDTDLPPTLTDLTYALVRAQPTMAPLLNLSNRILQSVHGQKQDSDLRSQIRGLAGAVINQLETTTSRIALHALQLFEDKAVVFTISHSSAVKKSLLKAKESGKVFSVICAESRPMKEGVDLARDLAGHGIPTTLIADAAMSSVLPEATMALVGADSLSMRGLVNKIGTCSLALGAEQRRIPFYVLCGTEKFIPENLAVIERTKAEEELLPEPIPDVSVRNVYFDATPLEKLTGVVTEEGSFSVEAVRAHLAALESNFALLPEAIGPPFFPR